MRIADISILIHHRETMLTIPQQSRRIEQAVLTITTDDGIAGHTFMGGPQADVTTMIVRVVKPMLIGRDPLDIGAIWGELGRVRGLDPTVQSYVDVALWDIAGKAAGLPVHRLLGTTRHSIPAYASSWVLPDAGAYADEAQAYRERGFVGYKIHPPSMQPGPRGHGAANSPHVERDIGVYRRVRGAVGEEYPLFADPFCGYTFAQAVRVGGVLDELEYEWFEDPLAAHDIDGYLRLHEKIRIPLMATEVLSGGLPAHVPWATRRATDYLRGDVVLKGGITGLVKLARLAEAFDLNCELHDGYNALNNLAVLHVALAIPNCEWYEVLVPHPLGNYDSDHLSWGLVENITIDRHGNASVPDRPGLGIDVDWDLLRANMVSELR
ncbi:mandelate racemase [Rhodococcus qingshengii]|uniref:enolase C-terminal domain-like protein n=1 Tax=Rhodococcus qingshengii TaxID=334542 RepID=UPI0007E54008|nr:enolase C-terminal domain-like protein [Rhodococcus qingshengii]BCF83308.1 mandelate racemase [Rhodococcus qingshengii]